MPPFAPEFTWGPVIVDARVDGDIVRTADGKSLPLSDVTCAPPCQPSKVVCVGFYYRTMPPNYPGSRRKSRCCS